MKAVVNALKAFLLLALFLFPGIEKEVHDWQHANDFHCTADIAHLHSSHHNCSLCDYIFPALADNLHQDVTFGDFTFKEAKIVCVEALFYHSPTYFVSLRGPPSIS